MRDIVDDFPAPDRPTSATVSPARILRLRSVKTGVLGRDSYVRQTFLNVIVPFEAVECSLFFSGLMDAVVVGLRSIEGFWSCNAKTREAAPFARPMSGARLKI